MRSEKWLVALVGTLCLTSCVRLVGLGPPEDVDADGDSDSDGDGDGDGDGDIDGDADGDADGDVDTDADIDDDSDFGHGADTGTDSGIDGDTDEERDAEPTPNACAPGATLTPFSADMAFCSESEGLGFDQCTAESLCNQPSWKLCPASTYHAAFSTSAPPVVSAWLAGCMRQGGRVVEPVDGICSDCDSRLTSSADYFWSCGGDTAHGTADRAVGLYSHSICYRAGINDPAAAAYWMAANTAIRHPAAVCCR